MLLRLTILICGILQQTMASLTPVYGKVGAPLELECLREVSADAVTWEKVTPVDVTLAYKNESNPDYPRIYATSNDGTGEYKMGISPFNVTDVGKYKCTLTKDGQNREILYDVNIAIAPTLEALSITVGDENAPTVVVWGDGKNVSCECTDGKPPPMVTLYQDGLPLINGTSSVSKNLILPSTLHTVLKCTAINIAITTEIEKETKVVNQKVLVGIVLGSIAGVIVFVAVAVTLFILYKKRIIFGKSASKKPSKTPDTGEPMLSV
ncbi:hypothetical protein ScPMuIL_002420 [Solemya velum]